MKIRYKLFLLVGAVFVISYLISGVVQQYVVSGGLKKSGEELSKLYVETSVQKIEKVNSFLRLSMDHFMVMIDSLLEEVQRFPNFGAFFEPSKHTEATGSWFHSATLFLYNKWIDFVQNTGQGEDLSTIVERPTYLESIRFLPVSPQFSLAKSGQKVFFAIPFQVHLTEEQLKELAHLPMTISPLAALKTCACNINFLFDCKQLLQLPSLEKGASVLGPMPLDLTPTLSSFEAAKQYLQQRVDTYPCNEEGMRALYAAEAARLPVVPQQGPPLPNPPFSPVMTSEFLSAIQGFREEFMDILLMHFFSIAFETGIFGHQISGNAIPQMVSFSWEKMPERGKGFAVRDVFFSKPLFEDQRYMQAHPPVHEELPIGSGMAIVKRPSWTRLVYGNTIRLQLRKEEWEKTSYLTIGVRLWKLLQSLSLSSGLDWMVTHDHAIVTTVSSKGKLLPNPETIDLHKMLTSSHGVVEWLERPFYFLRYQPYPELDLHFFSLTPLQEQLAPIRSLEKSSQQIVARVGNQMLIVALAALAVALLALHFLSKRMAKRVASLAEAAKAIREGKLEQVSVGATAGKDEISSLCRSFNEMVLGLQEKERVREVLHKVVSADIAEEILKGNVMLGGEEKRVTMLFADIREFSSMTSNMEPKEVIALLNQCMTRITTVIEQEGGVIDKYIGDAAMAIFGAPVPIEGGARLAVESALKIVSVLNEWNVERIAKGSFPVHVGIGIHTGVVCAGNMGAEDRLNYTVIGSAVNLASRLSDVAKPMEILISAQVLEEEGVREQVQVEELPPISLKGFAEKVTLYRVKGETHQT